MKSRLCAAFRRFHELDLEAAAVGGLAVAAVGIVAVEATSPVGGGKVGGPGGDMSAGWRAKVGRPGWYMSAGRP